MNLKQISSHSEALDKLKKLLKAANEIAEKIVNHGHPEEIPKMKSVLQKYEKAIAELEKTLPAHLFKSIDPAGMEYVKLFGGEFEMGDKDIKDNPPHFVTLRPFEISKTLVTQKQWRELTVNNPSLSHVKAHFNEALLGKNTDEYPMEQMTWYNAADYCKELSLKADDIDPKVKEDIKNLTNHSYLDYAFKNPEARLYRLPTEAEWEYAAKGGKNYEYGTADGKKPTPETGIALRSESQGTAPVTSTKPNPFGLYDMAGNLRQYTASWYEKDFYKKGQHYVDPIGPEYGEHFVLKGIRWDWLAPVAERFPRVPWLDGDDETPYDCGIRVVRYIGKDELP